MVHLHALTHMGSADIYIYKDFETHLAHHWGLKIGTSSKACLKISGADEVTAELEEAGWTAESAMRCLGMIIDGGGSAEPCFQATRLAAWKAFYANARAFARGGLRMSDATAIVSRSVAPVVLYRAPRWPYTATRAKQLMVSPHAGINGVACFAAAIPSE